MERRRVVVTGAAGGIGAAVCERLIADGFLVAALDQNEAGLQALAAKLGQAVSPYCLDQTVSAEARAAVARIEQEGGAIDALVNVTGWTEGTRFDQEAPDY